MPEFFRVVTPEQVFAILSGFGRTAVETLGLADAPGRICAKAIAAPEDLPPWPRATMDGYAVRAADTFGASESIPALLDVVGAVAMGELPGWPPGGFS